jgi:sugar/nucleoside kinase (ribokinase family)
MWKRLTVRNAAVEFELNKLEEKGVDTSSCKVISFSHRNTNLYIILYKEPVQQTQVIDPGARPGQVILADKNLNPIGGKKK